MVSIRASLLIQLLRLLASKAGGRGLIPGWGTKRPHMPQDQKKKKGIKKVEDYFREIISLPFPNKIFPETIYEEHHKEMELSCNNNIVVGSICSDRLLHIIKIIDPNTIATF